MKLSESTKYILRYALMVLFISILIATVVYLGEKYIGVEETVMPETKVEAVVVDEEPQSTLRTKYTSLDVPNINSSFKTWMDYRAVTSKNSPQYKFIHKWGWVDNQGFMRASGERDLGIEDDYYLIALGSYYGTTVGTKYKITTNTGNVFYGVLADLKSNRHTNATHQYAANRDVVEFLVDTRVLRKDVKRAGSANVYMPLNGSIAKIERIDFEY